MKITVTRIDAPVEKSKGNNRWNEVTIAFQGTAGSSTRTLRSFEGPIYSDIVKGGLGVYDVKVQKDGSFWKWLYAKKMPDAGVDRAEGVAVVAGDGKSGGSGGGQAEVGTTRKVGDWETKEERANKQVYIVRQSSVSSAIEFLAHFAGQDSRVTIDDVIDVARVIERFVFGDLENRSAAATGPSVEGPAVEAPATSEATPQEKRGRGSPRKAPVDALANMV